MTMKEHGSSQYTMRAMTVQFERQAGAPIGLSCGSVAGIAQSETKRTGLSPGPRVTDKIRRRVTA